jgi:aldose 1-epimerase
MPSSKPIVSLTKAPFGTLADGQAVSLISLTNSNGVEARIMTYGATLQALFAPDRKGEMADIVLGYDDLKGYVDHPQYLAVTVGRYANRIAKGRFTLEGQTYQLAVNNGPNALHGGLKGFDKVNWQIISLEEAETEARVTLCYMSPDGEEGYPGNLEVELTYILTDNNDLTLHYKATTDKPTIVNLTNHALFNLGGVLSGRSALEGALQVEADQFCVNDPDALPTGELALVSGTPFNFNSPQALGTRVRDTRHRQIQLGLGLDHNFVIRGGVTEDPKPAITFIDPLSGRGLKIATTEPGVQIYSGNYLNGQIPGKGGQAMRMGDGIAFEAQKFPDSPNQPAFPSARLNPGETYSQITTHHLFTA